MDGKTRLLSYGLALILGGSIAVVPRATAQENSAETAKRKVKTKTLPDYPELARQMNATGKVKIEATISADGTSDEHQSDRREPAAGGRGAGRVEEMAL